MWVSDDAGVVSFRDVAPASGLATGSAARPAGAFALGGAVRILEDARLQMRVGMLVPPDDPERTWRAPLAVRAASVSSRLGQRPCVRTSSRIPCWPHFADRSKPWRGPSIGRCATCWTNSSRSSDGARRSPVARIRMPMRLAGPSPSGRSGRRRPATRAPNDTGSTATATIAIVVGDRSGRPRAHPADRVRHRPLDGGTAGFQSCPIRRGLLDAVHRSAGPIPGCRRSARSRSSSSTWRRCASHGRHRRRSQPVPRPVRAPWREAAANSGRGGARSNAGAPRPVTFGPEEFPDRRRSLGSCSVWRSSSPSRSARRSLRRGPRSSSVNRVPFSADPSAPVVDPVFGRDIGFFLFELPFLRLMQSLFNGILIAALLAVGIRYLMAASRGVRVHRPDPGPPRRPGRSAPAVDRVRLPARQVRAGVYPRFCDGRLVHRPERAVLRL